jgi:hypothetical protein
MINLQHFGSGRGVFQISGLQNLSREKQRFRQRFSEVLQAHPFPNYVGKYKICNCIFYCSHQIFTQSGLGLYSL